MKSTNPEDSDYFTISSNTISSLSGVTYFSFTGVFQNIRFSFENDSGNKGTVDKMLYRH